MSTEQRELAEQQVEVLWKGLPPRILSLATQFGLIKLGWTLRDYVHEAIEMLGYETILDWGVQGSGKSDHVLIEGSWVYCKDREDYHGWDLVLKNLTLRPRDFVRQLKDIPIGKRAPWKGIDDVGVHFPSSKWRTDVKLYEAIDAAWAAIRTKCNVISLSIPLIDRLAKNIKDNLTCEVFIGRNQSIQIERYIRLPGIKKYVESSFFKIQLEPVHQFDLYYVPKDIFKQYWEEMRLPLTEEVLENLDQNLSPEGYTPVHEVAKLLNTSTNALVQHRRGSGVRGKIIDGLLHFSQKEIEQLRETFHVK